MRNRLELPILDCLRDQRGATSVEWILVLAVFVIPMVYVLGVLMAALVEHYGMITFFETLPFP
jgi:Flp pilus assembly pilin Flp